MVRALRYGFTFLLLGIAGYTLYIQAAPLLVAPCSKPITYFIARQDAGFGISTASLQAALLEAEQVWERAAGRELFNADPDGTLAVNLIYGDEQRAAELGQSIDSEQAAHAAKKRELDALKAKFNSAQHSHESAIESYERAVAKYNQEVAYWNTHGGAPPAEYEQLEAMQEQLRDFRTDVNESAEALNALVASINARVDELNALTAQLNAKVDVYNTQTGDEFDQGDYVRDREGTRITIYEFTSTADLQRVLAHEMGHALGMEHVENPESIMYSYNIGSGLVLTSEDSAALKAVCRLD